LLPILLKKDGLTSIFEAWPPSRMSVQGGDTMYWNDLPIKVLSAIAKDKLAVWPVIAPSSSDPAFSDLDSLLVASETDDKETLTTLALAGVSITQPPGWVKGLLLDAGVDFVLLTPDSAHQALLVSSFPVSLIHKYLMDLIQTIEGCIKAGLTALRTGPNQSDSFISPIWEESNTYYWITSYS
jgi:hypothetical protein